MLNRIADGTRTHTSILAAVQRQFETYRAGRASREPIPDHIREAAIRLCWAYPITWVCRVLRLSFPDLKKRLGVARVAFAELDLMVMAGPWQIESRRSDGSELRVTSTSLLPDLAGCYKTSWHDPDHAADATAGGAGTGGFSQRDTRPVRVAANGWDGILFPAPYLSLVNAPDKPSVCWPMTPRLLALLQAPVPGSVFLAGGYPSGQGLPYSNYFSDARLPEGHKLYNSSY